MADTRMTRFDTELFEPAAAEGRRENRSARQQLEHWTRVGREFSAHETAARRRIAAAVRGEAPIAALTDDERVVANVERDVAIRARAATTSFGRMLLASGVSAVALDEVGALTVFEPDGTSHPLADDRLTARRAPVVGTGHAG